ncbi:ABC transporter substrate-binding protein [Yinghuangia sp. YIM S09857]|uniref:ABC transporter substrate-binding protein n=1 Tax=Yinghuangia sp. YIM S09857 TaxID=3436929 RepID=UPI003F538EBA
MARPGTTPLSRSLLGRLRTRGAALGGALALGLTLAACGSSDTGGKSDGGGAMTMVAVSDSKSLDPFRTLYLAVTDEPRMSALYDPMLYIDPADGKVKPHLAESLTTADGGATWTLKLRPGVVFSDSTAFDATAVKLNWETHAKPETRSYLVSYAVGVKTQVVDPLTLTITPPAPSPTFDRTVATKLTYIEAPSAIAKGLDAAGTQPVGAGPFMLQSWTRGSEQVFVRNPNYWQKDKGLPKLDKITIKVVSDLAQQYSTVKAGGADLYHSSDPGFLTKAHDELKVIEQTKLGGQMVLFNLRRPPFDDVRARRAFALAIDPALIPKTLDNGFHPADSQFVSSPFQDPTAKQPAADQAEAQRLFDELASEGKAVDFTYLVPATPQSKRVAEYFQTRLQSFRNVSMKMEALEVNAFTLKYAIQHDFQAALTQQWLAEPEPDLYTFYHSASPQNFSGWNNPDADRALTAGRATADPEARKKAYADLQKAVVTDLPVIVYSTSVVGPIHTDKVTGVAVYNVGTVFMDRIGLA